MKNLKKSIISMLLILSIMLGAISTTVFAGSGEINVLGLLRVPFSFYINEGKTVEETLPNQNIKESSSFDDKEKTRQAIVNAPSEGGKFDFNATFYMKQSTTVSIFGRTFILWNQLVKTTNEQVDSLTPTLNGSMTKSYIDLVVKVDEKITPANQISAYFDSNTWRPIFVFDKDGNLLGDVRNSYVEGQSKKEFTFNSNELTEYIIRVVPMKINATKDEQDSPMKLGFDTPGNNNFTISRAVANDIAEKRRAMTDEEIAKEKELLNKTTGLTEDEITFLKKFNTYTYGNIKGSVTGSAPLIGEVPTSVDGRIPPTGIVATYENPKVTFYRNHDANDVEKIGKTLFVEYDKTIDGDMLGDYSMPADPTRDGYKFLGWSTDRAATSGMDSATISAMKVKQDVEYYAIWKEVEKQTVKHEFESAVEGKDLPQMLFDRVNGKDLTEQVVGTTVSPNNTIDLTNFVDDANDGFWNFVAWKNPTLKVVDISTNNVPDANTFIGTWNFTPNKHKVSYEFQPILTTKNLPEEVTKLVPTDDAEYVKGTVVNIPQDKMTFNDVEVSDGIWKFVSWNETSLNISTDNNENVFVGNWKFVEKGKLNFQFESGLTNITELPKEVTDLTPNPVDVFVGDNVKDHLVQPAKTEVVANAKTDEGEVPGKWVFREYVNTDREILKTPDTVIGKWDFYAQYNVNHSFKSGTPNMELPQEVKEQLPNPATFTKFSGEEAMSSSPLKTSVKVENGTWIFKGWEYNNKISESHRVTVNDDVEFVGIWEFEADPVSDVSYRFESITPNKTIPAEVEALKPANMSKKVGEKVNVTNSYEDMIYVGLGKWVFVEWSPSQLTVSKDETQNVFVGKWKFVKIVNVNYMFESATDNKDLPEEILNKVPTPYAIWEGSNVSTEMVDQTTVKVEGGTWTFKGWKYNNELKQSHNIPEIREDAEFVGVWEYVEDSKVNYKVTYRFESATASEVLPTEITDLLKNKMPNEVEEGTTVNVNPTTYTDVEVENGTWKFISWDKTSKVANSDIEFVGTWEFEKKPEPPKPVNYEVSFEFVSGTADKELPESIKKMVPENETVEANTNYKVEKTFNDVVVADGTWKFISWNETSKVINENTKFVGTWEFTAKPKVFKPITHEFVSGTEGKVLPEEVKAMLPKNLSKEVGEKVVVSPKTFEEVVVEDGKWIFTNWDKLELEVSENSVNKFVGTWEFVMKDAPKPLPKYVISNKFVSGTEGKELPQEVLDLLKPSRTVEEGVTVHPIDKTYGEVSLSDGKWVFEGWNSNEFVVTKDYTFVGTWKFIKKEAPKPLEKFTISYKFVSPNSKELPKEVLDMIPANQTANKGDVVNPNPMKFAPIIVDGGRWTFKGWHDKAYTVTGDFTFVGTWLFEENLYNEDLPEGTVEDTKKPQKPIPGNNGNTPSGKVLAKTGIASTSITTAIIALAGAVVFKRKRK